MNIWDVFEYTAAVSIVGLLIWGIKQIFHDKLDARWHYFIWLVLLVRLLVPVDFKLISTPLSVFQEISIGKWFEMGELLMEKQGRTETFALLGRIYLAGVLVLGIYYAAAWLTLRIRIGLAPKADEDTRNYVREIAGKYDLKGCRDIRICKSNTPFIFGVIAPILVLPENNLRPQEPIIVHELLHMRNKDVLINLGLHVVRVINWFNPLVWILTAVVQNDSEALCDQRVLERCGTENAKDYGEMLIAMTAGGRRNPVKVGTSNMASSYRNMQTRIRRIRDFRKVPAGLGLVTLCITLMLAVAGIGSSAAEANYFETPNVNSEKDLERGLLEAQCYHASTPQQAVYLFLRAAKERNLFYRMAVLPESQVSDYEEFAKICLAVEEEENYGDVETWDPEAYVPFFPTEMFELKDFWIYNMQYDETTGSATVWVKLNGEESEEDFVRWELELVNEEGWKVSLKEEGNRQSEEYVPEPLLYGSTQFGDFEVEILAYNEGRFNDLQSRDGGYVIYYDGAEQEKEEFPEFFTWEYTTKNMYLTYTGEEDLTGRKVRVEVVSDKSQIDDVSQAAALAEAADRLVMEAQAQAYETGDDSVLEEAKQQADELLALSGKVAAGEELTEEEQNIQSSMTSSQYSSSDGSAYHLYEGAELMSGEKKLISGGGSGYMEPGHGWSVDDKISAYVRIYIDGVLVKEGEVWSEHH